MDADFFRGKGNISLKETETIVSVHIPFTRKVSINLAFLESSF
jgi:hypothetical protein